MTRKRTWITLLCLFSCAPLFSTCPCRGESFHSPAYGYTITLPSDWQQVPQDVLNSAMEKLQNPNAPHRLIFDAAFQPAANKTWFEYPYMMVQAIPYSDFGAPGQLNEDQFPVVVKAISGIDVKKDLGQQLSSQAKSLIGGASFADVELDQPNRRFHLSIILTVTGIGEVHGQQTGHFGRDCMVQTMFYSKAADGLQFVDTGKSIADSFSFDPDKAYSDSEALAHPTVNRSIFDGTWPAICIGVAVSLVILKLRKPKPR